MRLMAKYSSLPLSAAALALSLALGTTTAMVSFEPAMADVASAKAAVDTAKAQGIVGEQGDGYLGLVQGSASSDVAAAVAEINAGRKAVYQSTAQKTGVTPQAAGEAAAQQLFAKVPAGQYYKPLGGGWTKK